MSILRGTHWCKLALLFTLALFVSLLDFVILASFALGYRVMEIGSSMMAAAALVGATVADWKRKREAPPIREREKGEMSIKAKREVEKARDASVRARWEDSFAVGYFVKQGVGKIIKSNP